MLSIAKLNFTFVDNDTGEVIKKFKYEQASSPEDKNGIVDIDNFVTNNILSSYVSSFRRGCLSRHNISLHIDFNIEKIF